MTDIADEAQVCVIGAGVMGLFAALELASRGFDVLVLDKSAPGLEASAATAGTLGIQNKSLPAIPLVLHSINMWRTLFDRLGLDVEYEKRGGFRLAHSDADLEKLEKAVESQRALGVNVEMVYQPRLAKEAPYLNPAVRAASYCPDDGMANPLATIRALVEGVRRRRVRIWTGCRVTAIEPQGDVRFVLQTERGLVRCERVLAAAGAWNLEVGRMVGVSLPVATEIYQVVTTDVSGPLFPHILTHIRGNLTVKQARATGKVLMGGAWRGEGDLETGVKRVRRDSLVGNLKWATQIVPGIGAGRLLRAWVGFEGRTPDKLLLSGAVGIPRGFYVLGCASGGFTLAPVAGVLAAKYLNGEMPDMPWEPYHVQRYLPAQRVEAAASGPPGTYATM